MRYVSVKLRSTHGDPWRAAFGWRDAVWIRRRVTRRSSFRYRERVGTVEAAFPVPEPYPKSDFSIASAHLVDRGRTTRE